MELSKLRNGSRSGPFESFRWGKYNRRKVKEIIKEDPMYIMVAVKDWLYLSPEQAEYFSLLYGGDIPPKFIRGFSPEQSPNRKISSPSESKVSSGFSGTDPDRIEQYLYENNKDILPNWDFDPDLKPEWVKNYEKALQNIKEKEGLEYVPILRRLNLYNTYEQKSLKESL